MAEGRVHLTTFIEGVLVHGQQTPFVRIEVETAFHALVRADQHVGQSLMPPERSRAVVVHVAEPAKSLDGQPAPEIQRRQQPATVGRQQR